MPVRTLLRSFKQKHQQSPLQFLRSWRLEAVYAELSSHTAELKTVTEVALRYGFSHLSRFAGEYRQVFHQRPSESLPRK